MLQKADEAGEITEGDRIIYNLICKYIQFIRIKREE